MALNNSKETLNNKNILFLIISCCALLNAQQLSSDRAIIFPDLDNHFTLVSDFHSHTAFSDGDVWPTGGNYPHSNDQKAFTYYAGG